MRCVVLMFCCLPLACSGRQAQGNPPVGPSASGDVKPGDQALGDPTVGDGPAGDPQPGDPLSGDGPAGDADVESGDTQVGDPPPGDEPAGDADAGPGDPNTGDAAGGDANGERGDPSAGDDYAGDPLPVSPPSCDQAGLCVRLTWNTGSGDLDLHLSRGNAPYCSEESCYFGNCQESSVYRVNWDGEPGVTAGDPHLADDSWGWGPEQIVVAAPLDGTYHAGVFYHASGDDPIEATLEVTVAGGALASVSQTLIPNQFWEAAALELDGELEPAATVLDRLCATGAWVCNAVVGACP